MCVKLLDDDRFDRENKYMEDLDLQSNKKPKQDVIKLFDEEQKAFHNGQLRKAISICNEIIDQEPYNGVAYYNKGEAYYHLSMHKKAEESLNNFTPLEFI